MAKWLYFNKKNPLILIKNTSLRRAYLLILGELFFERQAKLSKLKNLT